MKSILVTGAQGQIGSELVVNLREIYGETSVVASDLENPKDNSSRLSDSGPFETLNVLDAGRIAELVSKYKIDTIINLAALLSAVGEEKPQLLWDVNMMCSFYPQLYRCFWSIYSC